MGSAAGLADEVHLPDFEPSLHSKSFSVFCAETQLLFYINHVSCQSMTPLSFFPGNSIQRFYHLAICFIFGSDECRRDFDHFHKQNNLRHAEQQWHLFFLLDLHKTQEFLQWLDHSEADPPMGCKAPV